VTEGQQSGSHWSMTAGFTTRFAYRRPFSMILACDAEEAKFAARTACFFKLVVTNTIVAGEALFGNPASA